MREGVKSGKGTGLHAFGDITSDENIDKSNVEAEIYKFADRYRKDKKLKLSDIWQIVQIFDTDGAYIDDSYIVRGKSAEIAYSTNLNIYFKENPIFVF